MTEASSSAEGTEGCSKGIRAAGHEAGHVRGNQPHVRYMVLPCRFSVILLIASLTTLGTP